jgi:hypothetical protein
MAQGSQIRFLSLKGRHSISFGAKVSMNMGRSSLWLLRRKNVKRNGKISTSRIAALVTMIESSTCNAIRAVVVGMALPQCRNLSSTRRECDLSVL